ncbi:MAG: PEP-CTERM sorting domain-containing protein [Terracidiphilus sp.]
MKSKFYIKTSLCAVVLALFALACAPAFAAAFATTSNPCPTPTGGSSGGEALDSGYLSDITSTGGATCNDLIVFESNGSIVTTNPNPNGFYDAGGDDNLVGIINDTGSPINSIDLSSASTDIFGFDGDGICGTTGGGYTFSASGTGGATACSGATDPNGYGGPGVTYSGINVSDTAGVVNFAGGIAAGGGTSFFSLEGPVALDLTVTSGATPEPSSYLLFGTGLLGLFFLVRRKLLA